MGPRADRLAPMTARCDQCGKPLRAGRVVGSPDGMQFDSLTCRKAYSETAQMRALQNVLRVARSRLKATAITRAASIYRHLGGRDWPLVERVLRAIL
jgi:hypothetical protein